jgi:hypothetical protein
MLRVKLSSKDYLSYQVNGDQVQNDILEQTKFNTNGSLFTFYEMFIPVTLSPNEVKVVKLSPGQTKEESS